MNAICTKFDKVDVFHFTEEFTAQDSEAVSLQFMEVKKNKDTKVLLDFSKLLFIDSTAIGLLIKNLLEIRMKNGKILLFNPTRQPLNLLRLIGVDQVFSIEFSRRKAFSKLRK